MIISCIEGRHFLFMDRGQTFFSMDEAKIFFSHMVKARIFLAKTRAGILFFSKLSNGLMVAPLFIDEENLKLLLKYSNCVTFVASCHY